ncbi:MAG: ABC transporter ATP-binding protein [Gammaproteobacteria bacterium]
MKNSTRRVREDAGVAHLYAELWRLAKEKRPLLAGACVLLVLAQVILLAVPYVAGKAINALQLQGSTGLGEAGMWLAGAVVLAVSCWALHGPGRVLERNVALHVRHRLAVSLIERLLSLPLGWHESHHSGESAHRVQQSTNALASFAQSQYIYLNSAIRLIGPLVALWYIEPVVGAACILGFAVISLSVLGFDRAMIRLAREENAAERKYAAALVDALGNIATVAALRQARGVRAMLETRLLAIFEPLKRAILVNEAKWCVVDLATRTLSAALVALFAWKETRGTAPGVHTALMLGSLYMVWEYASQAGSVVASIAQHFQSFARQRADYMSASVIREASPTPAAPGPAPRDTPSERWRRLDLQHFTFRHPGNRRAEPALDNISLTLERGKRYAVIGDSGSGKSTLLRALAGLYSGERGIVRTDAGTLITCPTDVAAHLRSCATLIPQDAEVFAGSIAQNLGLCESVDGTASPDHFRHALQVARADFIDTSNAGMEAEVAERAANWSGGQRSRIALARGVLAARGSALVLLDEPTAHLDPATESAVYDNLFAEFADACVISSVHRLNLLERFDEVLYMQSGRLIAQAPAHTLRLAMPGTGELEAAPHTGGGSESRAKFRWRAMAAVNR